MVFNPRLHPKAQALGEVISLAVICLGWATLEQAALPYVFDVRCTSFLVSPLKDGKDRGERGGERKERKERESEVG